MSDLIKKAQRAQKEKRKIIEQTEAEIRQKRKAEADARQARLDAYQKCFEAFSKFNGHRLNFSSVYTRNGGWTVWNHTRAVALQPFDCRYGYGRTDCIGFRVFEHSDDISVSFNTKDGEYKLVQRVVPREALLKFEDIQPDHVWTGSPPDTKTTLTFSEPERLLRYLEGLIVNNLDLTQPLEAPKPDKSAPETPTPNKVDVEVRVNNPKVKLTVVKS